MKLLIMQFSPVSFHFIFLDLNIPLSILFSNTINPRSFLKDRNQVSHPYEATAKIIIIISIY
jgi:hypothetical protein